MLDSILNLSSATAEFSLGALLLCTLVSIVSGIFVALLYMYKNTYSKPYVITLALMPMIVQFVIMLVNGNLDVGVTVAGAFTLVRFRSVPGSAKDIGSIFLAMALGLATGMGYLGVAVIMFVAVGAFMLILQSTHFAVPKNRTQSLKITIPESLEYDSVFDDLFKKYVAEIEITKVKTTAMGSLFELSYEIKLKPSASEKEFIDALRCRNGNLSISLGRLSTIKEEL